MITVNNRKALIVAGGDYNSRALAIYGKTSHRTHHRTDENGLEVMGTVHYGKSLVVHVVDLSSTTSPALFFLPFFAI